MSNLLTGLVILILAIILFVSAILSDKYYKKKETKGKNRKSKKQ